MSVTGPSLQAVLQQLQATATQATAQPRPIATAGANDGESFASALVASIDKIDGMKQSAVAQGEAFERGDSGIGINDVMVDMQKASVAFEMGMQVRNRVITAYKDIMNMQV